MAPIDKRPGIRPRPNLGRRLDIAARYAFPGSATVLLMLLTQMPLDLPGQAALLPSVALGCIWFWSVYWPDALPPPMVFLFGLLLDLLGYLPLGTGAFILLVVQGLTQTLRRALARRGFAWVWIVFGLVASGASVLLWVLVMLLTFRILSPVPAVFIAVLSTSIYPVVATLFAAAHRSIVDPERV